MRRFQGFVWARRCGRSRGGFIWAATWKMRVYGLTICAERVAIFKALSEGERGFEAVAVVADTENMTPPCGACRQIIWEFCGDVPVIMSNLSDKVERESAGTLLPRAFDQSFL